MKIYLAGKWTEKDSIKIKMDELEFHGFNITHDWTTFEASANSKAEMAHRDIKGVNDADIVIILMNDPNYPYRGSFTELGAALGLNKKIYIICPDENATCRTNVFFHHPIIKHLNNWNELMDILLNLKLSG